MAFESNIRIFLILSHHVCAFMSPEVISAKVVEFEFCEEFQPLFEKSWPVTDSTTDFGLLKGLFECQFRS